MRNFVLFLILALCFGAKNCTLPAGYGYGFGYGYGGFLSQTKDLFELYMDQDSEGGTSITKNEQQEIIKTINAWF